MADSSDREPIRQAVNNWIRSEGGADSVIDLDAKLRDVRNSARLRAGMVRETIFIRAALDMVRS